MPRALYMLVIRLSLRPLDWTLQIAHRFGTIGIIWLVARRYSLPAGACFRLGFAPFSCRRDNW
ncbi:hypothetical protein BQ8482_130121 [Mesorhizobium delmotii]|uniref:Uncharacterized protein n=1 Tax=Mesorhizobium delmotii TaxID=1631247 RepID=A0A2P9AGE9_9HYPH|nr:hypothetical protein BQ8482_130121 [Mesorhizobium delmotii]